MPLAPLKLMTLLPCTNVDIINYCCKWWHIGW